MKHFLHKSLFLLLVFLCMGINNAFAYTPGQTIIVDGIIYQILDNPNTSVSAVGTTKGGIITLPQRITDPQDPEKTFTVIRLDSYNAGWSKYPDIVIDNLILPEGMTTIKSNIAAENNSIKKITFSSTISTLDPISCFIGMDGLEEFVVPEDNLYFCSEDGILFNKSKSQLIRFPTAKSLADGSTTYNIPASVTNIASSAFCNNMSIHTINIHENVTEIGMTTMGTFPNILESIVVDSNNPNYFSNNGVLYDKNAEGYPTTLLSYPRWKQDENFIVYNNVTKIASNAIYGTQIKTLDLNNVETLDQRAITYCNKMTSITIPTTLLVIEDGSITSCKNLTNFNVESGHPNYSSIDGVLFNADKTVLILFPIPRTGDYTVPSSVVTIASRAFLSTNIENVIISKNVEDIGEACFSGSAIKTISFVEDCNLTTLAKQVFYNCQNLEDITIPASVDNMDEAVFFRCSNLKSVTFSSDSKLKELNRNIFRECSSLETVEFETPNSLEKILSQAFLDCSKLSTFTVPQKTTFIGTRAFDGCPSLEEVFFEDGSAIQTISDGAFSKSGLKQITIPESVKSIGNEAFANCDKLEEIHIPKYCRTIASDAFKFCTNLVNIDVANGNFYYSSLDGMLLSADKYTLVIFPPGKANDKFTLLCPAITAIGDYAFYSCTNLKNVTIPNYVASIGKRAFGLCENLNTITFLGEDMIDPANIAQGDNEVAFDTDMFNNITIVVRDGKQNDYAESPFYSKFSAIKTSFMVTKDGYTEEYIPVSDNAVDLLKTTCSDVTYVLPRTVGYGGDNYTVSLIGDYAFNGVGSSVKEVIVFDNVEYIGARAFMTDQANQTSTVQSVFFIESNPTKEMLSTTRFELSNDYAPVASSTTIYVKPSALEKYKTAWTNQASQIDYKIPGVNIATKYGTFSREFDTDFTQYSKDNGGISDVRAFVGGVKDTGAGDWGNETEYHITFEPTANNGTYVPANTGVLLKVIGSEDATGAGFYYCIHEDAAYNKEPNVPTNNLIPSGSVDKEIVSDGNLYVMSKGYMTRVKAGGKASVSAHKAYLQLSPEAQGKKLVMSFYDEDENIVTSLGDIDVNTPSTEVYYDLSGRRIVNPVKGIYVVNGKKVVL